ncbi:uncharacterized protein LOC116936213 [Daphnia magna]|uniref:uncharacterized protein LOC116936213 n=1 Tax=Daphnia magna TaxID=35525 RepID=UPI001E1BD498|nr:uncharacterized protein LOC116936213 [Daphnia magna]
MDSTSSPLSEGSYSIDSRVNFEEVRRRSPFPSVPRSSRSRSRSWSRRYDVSSQDRYRHRRDRSRERRRRDRSRSRDRHRRRSPRRSSRSRSRSRRRERSSRSSQTPPPTPVLDRIFPKEASAQLASWMSVGQKPAQTRELRDIFKPAFEDENFLLSCPKMDDVVERQISRNRHSKFIAQRELIWKSTHLKVLDIVRPLISLWNRLAPNTEEGSILESAIRLWAEAHFFISKNRRANVMNSVYPRFKSLLKDPTNFSPSEVAQLFGPTFTSALLQAADEDAKLQKVASVGRISGGFGQKTQQKPADKPEDPRPGTSRQGDPSERRGYQTRSRGGGRGRQGPLRQVKEASK